MGETRRGGSRWKRKPRAHRRRQEDFPSARGGPMRGGMAGKGYIGGIGDRGAPCLADLEDARRLLAPLLDPTPLLGAPGFSRLAGREARLKAENLQVAGSFKIRGAYNRISRLKTKRGVIAASAGNHAQGVALAAARLGIPST